MIYRFTTEVNTENAATIQTLTMGVMEGRPLYFRLKDSDCQWQRLTRLHFSAELEYSFEPTKQPWGRDKWERTCRVRCKDYSNTTLSVGAVSDGGVKIDGHAYTFEKAAALFLTLDNEELYE